MTYSPTTQIQSARDVKATKYRRHPVQLKHQMIRPQHKAQDRLIGLALRNIQL